VSEVTVGKNLHTIARNLKAYQVKRLTNGKSATNQTKDYRVRIACPVLRTKT